MGCLFLDTVPLEIRNKIYSYLLSTEYTKRPVCDDEKASRAERGIGSRHLFDFQPAILLANKRINKEASAFLYNENLFVLVRYPYVIDLGFWTMDLDLTLLAVGDKEVSRFRSALLISLEVNFCVPAKDVLHHDSQFMITANDLPVFCRILKKLDNLSDDGPDFLSGFALVLKMFPAYRLGVDTVAGRGSSCEMSKKSHSLPHQRTLLEPFVALHGIIHFEIADVDGKAQYVDAQLLAEVKERASRPPDSMGAVLEKSAKIKEQGNKAFRARDFALADSLYSLALENLDNGRRYLNTDVRKGIPDEMAEITYFQEHWLLAMRTRSNSVAVLLHLQQWRVAHERATEIIAKIKDAEGEVFLNVNEVAKIYHRRALASKGMGKVPRAVDEIREALRLDPTNARMKTELREWLLAKNQKQVKVAMKALTM